MMGRNISRIHDSLRPLMMTTAAVKKKVKNCCIISASTLDIANCTRSMSLTIVDISDPVACFWKKAAERRSTAL